MRSLEQSEIGSGASGQELDSVELSQINGRKRSLAFEANGASEGAEQSRKRVRTGIAHVVV